MSDDKRESIKLDEILKSLFNISNKVLVGLLNAIFDENFKEDEVTISVSNNEFVSDKLEIIRGDMFFDISEQKDKKTSYHIEFQTKNDTGMVIRTFEYGFEKAKENSKCQKGGIKTLYFPKQKVIFFEENKSIQDELKLRVIFPDNQEILYTAGVLKYWELTEEDIINKKMYPLLPLQLFNLRKELIKLCDDKEKNEEKIKELSNKARELSEKLSKKSMTLFEEEEVFMDDVHQMFVAIQNLIKYLNRNFLNDDKIEEEVVEMTKSLYDPKVHQEGLIEGMEIGLEKGMEKGVIKGKFELKIEEILEQLSELGTTPRELEDIIKKQKDLDTLKKWFKISLKCESVEEFESKIN